MNHIIFQIMSTFREPQFGMPWLLKINLKRRWVPTFDIFIEFIYRDLRYLHRKDSSSGFVVSKRIKLELPRRNLCYIFRSNFRLDGKNMGIGEVIRDDRVVLSFAEKLLHFAKGITIQFHCRRFTHVFRRLCIGGLELEMRVKRGWRELMRLF